MKKLHLLLFVAALSCLMMGCRKPVNVEFGADLKTIAAEGGTCTVELKSNGDWTIGSTAEWLTVSPTSGNGDATINIEVQPNPANQVRSQEITATTKDNTASMTIEQEGNDGFITLMPTSMLGDWEGGSFMVTIQSNVLWTVSTMPEWVTCSTMSGDGNDSLWMTMKPFFGHGIREADITFGNEYTYAKFHVKQIGANEMQHFLNVNPNELHVACTGDVKTLTVTCDGAWVVSSGEAWVSFDKTEGESNDVVVVTIAENPLYVTRNCDIKFVSDSDLLGLVEVIQEASPDPHYLEVSPMEFLFGNEGGNLDVTIECDADWEVAVGEEWLTVSMTQGSGNGTVTITATPNVFNETRRAVIKIVSGNIMRGIAVTQEPGEVQYLATVEPDSLFVGPNGGSCSFTLTSNTSWTITVPSWVTYCPITSGTGDATVSIDMWLDANDDYFSRVGYIPVMHNGRELARVVLVQEGIPNILSTNVSELNFTAEGGTQYFHLTANQDWAIHCDEEWLYFDPNDGSGDMEVLVKVGPWISSEPREATFIIKGNKGKTVYITVRQSN